MTTATRALAAYPSLSGEGGLAAYLQAIRRFPLLTLEEEQRLAVSWRDHGDITAAHRLVTSHLRLVVKVAAGYRGYGLPFADLIAEGNIGLMQAVKRFDPAKGFRLATYALWWIRASLQEFVLRSWSLVKISSSAVQKRLFFNLRRLKRALSLRDDEDLTPEHLHSIAQRLGVEESEVTSMNGRLSGPDRSLNVLLPGDGAGEALDRLPEEGANQETLLGDREETASRQALLTEALETLDKRERTILVARRLQDPPATLEELSQQHGVSRERVRQIETRAFARLESFIRRRATDGIAA